MSDIASAKELFFKYNGSYYLMSREGVLDLYKAFNIPKALEQSWLDEEVLRHLEKIRSNECEKVTGFDNLCSAVRKSGNVGWMQDVTDVFCDVIKEKYDDDAVYAIEIMCETMRFFLVEKKPVKKEMYELLNILEEYRLKYTGSGRKISHRFDKILDNFRQLPVL